ncbi:hypothetical protein TNCV_1754811 [Trichonephila clavipes]|nr:hypothetical protein TNCV_1754811 [Trichonephila clavipes]
MLSLPQQVGLLFVDPWKVLYFPSTPPMPMEAFPDPPPGDAPSKSYRLPRETRLSLGLLKQYRNAQNHKIDNINSDSQWQASSHSFHTLYGSRH